MIRFLANGADRLLASSDRHLAQDAAITGSLGMGGFDMISLTPSVPANLYRPGRQRDVECHGFRDRKSWEAESDPEAYIKRMKALHPFQGE